MPAVTPVRMPKWGLSMQEGAVTEWWKAEGASVTEGEDLVDIETSKISNVYESPASGVLKRIVAHAGETLPVGALLGVIGDALVAEDVIDAFVADFQATFVPEEGEVDDGLALALSTVDVAGRAIRVGRTGPATGTPTVLIHGYSGDLNNWLFNIEALAAVGPVIAVDLPGHGQSSKDVGDGSLQTLADAVGGALEALGVREAHLVGHSLGAAVAARLAVDRPGLAKSLVLIAPVGFSASPVSEAFLTGVIEARRAKDLRPVLEMLLSDPSKVTRDMVEDVLKLKRVDGVEEALSLLRDRIVAGDDAAALRGELAAIAKAAVIASPSDPIVGAPDARFMPPDWNIIWIEGAGHMPHLEKSAEVNAAILAARPGA